MKTPKYVRAAQAAYEERMASAGMHKVVIRLTDEQYKKLNNYALATQGCSQNGRPLKSKAVAHLINQMCQTKPTQTK